jgi:hypothetical protein
VAVRFWRHRGRTRSPPQPVSAAWQHCALTIPQAATKRYGKARLAIEQETFWF